MPPGPRPPRPLRGGSGAGSVGKVGKDEAHRTWRRLTHPSEETRAVSRALNRGLVGGPGPATTRHVHGASLPAASSGVPLRGRRRAARPSQRPGSPSGARSPGSALRVARPPPVAAAAPGPTRGAHTLIGDKHGGPVRGACAAGGGRARARAPPGGLCPPCGRGSSGPAGRGRSSVTASVHSSTSTRSHCHPRRNSQLTATPSLAARGPVSTPRSLWVTASPPRVHGPCWRPPAPVPSASSALGQQEG